MIRRGGGYNGIEFFIQEVQGKEMDRLKHKVAKALKEGKHVEDAFLDIIQKGKPN